MGPSPAPVFLVTLISDFQWPSPGLLYLRDPHQPYPNLVYLALMNAYCLVLALLSVSTCSLCTFLLIYHTLFPLFLPDFCDVLFLCHIPDVLCINQLLCFFTCSCFLSFLAFALSKILVLQLCARVIIAKPDIGGDAVYSTSFCGRSIRSLLHLKQK